MQCTHKLNIYVRMYSVTHCNLFHMHVLDAVYS